MVPALMCMLRAKAHRDSYFDLPYCMYVLRRFDTACTASVRDSQYFHKLLRNIPERPGCERFTSITLGDVRPIIRHHYAVTP